MNQNLNHESLWIPIGEDTLHLKRYYTNPNGQPVFCLHGSIENGKMFYSKNHKGLAPYLAKQGYDVFVADLRGKGESYPAINKNSQYGQTEAILEDIPAFINKIIEFKGKQPQHWVAHSWGGVLFMSYLARFPEKMNLVDSMTLIATKRTISIFNFDKLYQIHFFWNTLSRILVKIYGFLPAVKFGAGSDNETDKFHLQTKNWCNKGCQWIDSDDGFDYAQKIKSLNLPRTLFLTGAADSCLGHPSDVKDFLFETDVKNYEFIVLGKKNAKHNYGHVDILTHKDAESDHFPKIKSWLQNLNLFDG